MVPFTCNASACSQQLSITPDSVGQHNPARCEHLGCLEHSLPLEGGAGEGGVGVGGGGVGGVGVGGVGGGGVGVGGVGVGGDGNGRTPLWQFVFQTPPGFPFSNH